MLSSRVRLRGWLIVVAVVASLGACTEIHLPRKHFGGFAPSASVRSFASSSNRLPRWHPAPTVFSSRTVTPAASRP